MKTKYKGFTLIELLVVIAIIAILASIMLPFLAHPKHKQVYSKPTVTYVEKPDAPGNPHVVTNKVYSNQ